MSLQARIRKKLGGFTLDVTIDHQDGTTGILGASGCGKSLTLQAIAGVMRPDEGRIVLNGRVLFDSEKRICLAPQDRHVGYLFQNYALFPTMTVAQNVSCGVPRGTNRDHRRRLVREWIENLQLAGLENHRPQELSGGQQQRTALARVLIGHPEILMLDEPFSALDSFLREQLVTELRVLLQHWDKDALLVTHNRDEAYELCETTAIMADGRILMTGPTKDVFASPGTRTAAILTGCKNVVSAQRAGSHTLRIPDWGICLDTAQEVPPGVTGAAIRAHYFSPDNPQNVHPVQIMETVEEPFAWIYKFRYVQQKAGTPLVWWRVSKQSRCGDCREAAAVGVSPEDVLILCDKART